MSAFKKLRLLCDIPVDKVTPVMQVQTSGPYDVNTVGYVRVAIDLEIFNKAEVVQGVADFVQYGHAFNTGGDFQTLLQLLYLIQDQAKDTILDQMKRNDERWNERVKNQGYFRRLWQAVKGQYAQV